MSRTWSRPSYQYDNDCHTKGDPFDTHAILGDPFGVWSGASRSYFFHSEWSWQRKEALVAVPAILIIGINILRQANTLARRKRSDREDL